MALVSPLIFDQLSQSLLKLGCQFFDHQTHAGNLCSVQYLSVLYHVYYTVQFTTQHCVFVYGTPVVKHTKLVNASTVIAFEHFRASGWSGLTSPSWNILTGRTKNRAYVYWIGYVSIGRHRPQRSNMADVMNGLRIVPLHVVDVDNDDQW